MENSSCSDPYDLSSHEETGEEEEEEEQPSRLRLLDVPPETTHSPGVWVVDWNLGTPDADLRWRVFNLRRKMSSSPQLRGMQVHTLSLGDSGSEASPWEEKPLFEPAFYVVQDQSVYRFWGKLSELKDALSTLTAPSSQPVLGPPRR